MLKISLILSLLFSLNVFAQSSVGSFDVFESHYASKNLVKNPFCRKNTTNITASAGALSRTATAGLNGFTDCTWDPAASGNTLKFATKTLPGGLKGQNCEAKIAWLGDASLVKAYVLINSVQVTSSFQLWNSGTLAGYQSINYPCGDGSTAIDVTLEATGNAANVQYMAFTGEATNIGSSAVVTSWAAYTPTITGFGTASAVDFRSRQVGPNIEIEGKFTSGTPTAVSGAITLPTNITPDPTLIPTLRPMGLSWRNTASTQNTMTTMLINGSQTSMLFSGSVVSSTNSPFVSALANSIVGAGDIVVIHVEFPVSGWTGMGQTANLSTLPANWSGYHDDTCVWAVTNTAYTNFTADASCALVQRQATNISCTTSGSILPALACTLPKTGMYYICANPSAQTSTGGAGGGVRLWDGTTTIAEALGHGGVIGVVPLCGLYNATSLTPTFSLQGKASSGAENITRTAAGGAVGVIEWTILDVSHSFPTPLLVGSVSSNSTGAERIERATILMPGTPAIGSQSGTWISSLTDNGAGDTTINFTAGIFSGTPTCTCTPVDGASGNTNTCIISNATAASSSLVRTVISAGASASDRNFHIICMGPR